MIDDDAKPVDLFFSGAQVDEAAIRLTSEVLFKYCRGAAIGSLKATANDRALGSK